LRDLFIPEIERSTMKKEANSGKVMTDASFQFLVWIKGKVEKFPRSHKFNVGDRIYLIALDIQQGLVEATYSRDRAACPPSAPMAQVWGCDLRRIWVSSQ
jgi:hypothetical protein